MTNNLTTSETLTPAMELDLDSFLNSPLTSDDEYDDKVDDSHNLNSVPHRTIDEILNASDASTSSDSPPPSPPSIHPCFLVSTDPKQDQDDANLVSTTKPPAVFHCRNHYPKTGSTR